MMSAIRRLSAIAFMSLLFFTARAQPSADPAEKKPYRVLTSGKQVTIKSTKNIRHIMLWTTGGDRIVEQKEVNASSFVINLPLNQKTFFLMVGLSDGKIYTEKIGTQQ